MKKIIALLLVLSLLICAGYAIAAGGGPGDPLISLSYVRDIFMPSVLVAAENRLDKELESIDDEMSSRLDNIYDSSSGGYNFSGGYSNLSFLKGGTLAMDELTSFVLTSGLANIAIDSGEVIDATTGQTVAAGSVLIPNHRYFAAEGSSAFIRMYDRSTGMIDGYYLAENSGTIPPNLQFIDVPIGHWANDYITYLADNGIVNGVGDSSYAPGGTVTRATFVTILGRLNKIDISQYLSTDFNDVDIDTWYGPYIAWASQNGIVSGYGNGKFGPADNISREQMAVLIMRYADYAKVNLPPVTQAEEFQDQDIISEYAGEAVKLAQTSGIINGKPGGIFDPKGTAARADISAVIFRFIKNAGLPV